jgi:hypothetical protein
MLAEPFVIRRPQESYTEGFIQIIDVPSGNRVVTVIEFLSPTNKGDGRARVDYRKMQMDLWNGRVSLVEVDLLRRGDRVLQISDDELPASQRATYAACVHRGYGENIYEYYAMPLRERLKGIRIPLRERDPDATLDIQSLIDQAYANGAYDDLDYSREPIPPLTAEDATWAGELLRSAGKR